MKKFVLAAVAALMVSSMFIACSGKKSSENKKCQVCPTRGLDNDATTTVTADGETVYVCDDCKAFYEIGLAAQEAANAAAAEVVEE